MDSVTFHPVTAGNWDDLSALFGAKGGPSYCWCMVWRRTAEGGAAPRPGPARRAALQGLVTAGTPVGLVGRCNGQTVAWVSLAPRAALQRSWGPEPEAADLWCISCFFIPRVHRGQGLVSALIGAAEAFARESGARRLMAAPVDPDSPSYRFAGYLPTFVAAGYTRTGAVGTRRHVVVKTL